MSEILIRPARRDDLPALVGIYNHYVANGHANFTTEQQTVASRSAWFDGYAGGPHRLLVAQAENRVVGYAGSARYRPAPAFDHTVETSVYLHPDERGRGTGSRLYAALLDALAGEPVHLAVAGVALPNAASVALHRRHGFREVGTFEEYARKRGVWISSTWFQRPMNR